MKLHNTLTRQTEDFKPLDDNKVRVYSCGPTVYDHAHIGNLSSYIYFDLLRRVLQASDYNVQHVMNITDIEDKIFRRAAERYPDESPEVSQQKLTQEYSQLFMDDMQAIGNNTADMKFIWATAAIEGIRALIRELHQDGFAYIADGSVYFSIAKYKDSGKKYGQLLEITADNTSAARIDNDEYDKESVHDFVLWKGAKPGEPTWEFELDGHNLTGRPGWHIECSVMSVGELGQPFDIHTGGVDLIFPHHENEIAQSTAGKGDLYSKFFVHNEHILVDGKKMSKSLGNFFTLQDVRERGYEPMAFRLLVLQSHYRSQSNFTWENLEAATNRLHNWRMAASYRWQTSPDGTTSDVFTQATQALLLALQNDLNTPEALRIIDKAFDAVMTSGLAQATLQDFIKFLQTIYQTLGFELAGNDIAGNQKQLIQDRARARDQKDWASADKIRDTLTGQGIAINDTPHGQTWYRI